MAAITRCPHNDCKGEGWGYWAREPMERLYKRRMVEGPIGHRGEPTRKASGWDPIGYICAKGHIKLDARPETAQVLP